MAGHPARPLVRHRTVTATLDFGAGDSSSPDQISDVSASFDTAANNGAGEWAGGQLVIRPGADDSEALRIETNTGSAIQVEGRFASAAGSGDRYQLRRAEFFEPDLDDPIESDRFDPNNPDLSANDDLTNFIEAYEIDADGEPFGGPLDVTRPLPAFCELRVTFSEAMDPLGTNPWDAVRIAAVPDDETTERLAQIVARDGARQWAIRPALVNADGSTRVVGWGTGTQDLQLILTTVPDVNYLRGQLSADDVTAFLREGVRAIGDLGGRALGFPDSAFRANDPPIRFVLEFSTDDSISDRDPAPRARDYRVIVHRFRGTPEVSVDPDTLRAGVTYRGSSPGYYEPVNEVNLEVAGRLTGPATAMFTKVLDDFNPPPGESWPAFGGSGTPLITNFAGGGAAPHDGARFQNIYRDIDIMPGESLRGTYLTLYRISFAPNGGNVAADTYEDVSIHAAHSAYRPSTKQSLGISAFPWSGLGIPYDYDTWISQYTGGGSACPASNRTVGFVFQDAHLLPQYTVLENVLVMPTLAFPPQPPSAEETSATPSCSTESACRTASVAPPGRAFRGREAARLPWRGRSSTGPAMLLCDEPTGSLDRSTSQSVADLLFELHREASNVMIVVTHDLTLAGRFPRRCELKEGRCSEL